MTRLGQLREMLAVADSRRYDAHTSEGTDEAGRHVHSLCGHDGDPLDDRGHVCFGQIFGDSKEEAAARAVLVAKALQELPDLLTELHLLRRMATASETLLADKRVTVLAQWNEETMLRDRAADPVRSEFEETVRDWAAYWKPKP